MIELGEVIQITGAVLDIRFPSGAPAIFIDAAARLGIPAGMIGGVGDDGFGKNLLLRLQKDGVERLFVTHGTINPNARGFWDKYFMNYSYTLTRVIDSDMLGGIVVV